VQNDLNNTLCEIRSNKALREALTVAEAKYNPHLISQKVFIKSFCKSQVVLQKSRSRGVGLAVFQREGGREGQCHPADGQRCAHHRGSQVQTPQRLRV